MVKLVFVVAVRVKQKAGAADVIKNESRLQEKTDLNFSFSNLYLTPTLTLYLTEF